MKKQILFLATLAIFAFTANATKWRVNNNPIIDADFRTFNEAHDGASAGDTIYLEGSMVEYGTYDTIYKQMTIIGPGYFLEENDSTQACIMSAKLQSFVIETTAAGTQIIGVEFESGKLYIKASLVLISNCKTTNIYLEHTDDFISGVTIRQNYIQGSILDEGSYYAISSIHNNIVNQSIQLIDVNSSHNIYNNTTLTGGYSISAHNSTIRSNLTYSISGNNNLLENNITYQDGNISDYIINSGSTDGKYKLKEGSAAIGAGYNGVDCGAYGGSGTYRLSGITNIPHIFEAEVSNSGSNQTGLPVYLKVTSKNNY